MVSEYAYNWPGCSNICESNYDGYLADITTQEEQLFVERLLSVSGVKDAWFGLRRLLTWSDGSYLVPASATWQNIVADDDSTCFQIQYNFADRRAYEWLDVPCDEVSGFICETEGTWVYQMYQGEHKCQHCSKSCIEPTHS